jgi:hypothetical protein
MPNIENRLRRVEIATESAEGHVIYISSDAVAEATWAAAIEQGKPAGLFIVKPGQVPPVIVGPTIKEMFEHVAKHGRRIHDKDPAPLPDDGSYLWRAPRPGELRTTH